MAQTGYRQAYSLRRSSELSPQLTEVLDSAHTRQETSSMPQQPMYSANWQKTRMRPVISQIRGLRTSQHGLR